MPEGTRSGRGRSPFPRSMLLAGSLVLAIGPSRGSASPVARDEIGRSVAETSGVGRQRAGVALGVPLGPGVSVPTSCAWELRDSGGSEVPVQVAPLVVDDSGDVRWLRVRFEADVAARSRRRFVLARRPVGSSLASPTSPIPPIVSGDGIVARSQRLVARIGCTEGPLVQIVTPAGDLVATVGAPEGEVDGKPVEVDRLSLRALVLDDDGPIVVRALLE